MLNEAQERSLSATFQLVEDRLREMEVALKSADYIGILRDKINDVSPEVRPALFRKADLIKERIKVLSEKLQLNKRRTETTSETLAGLAYCWEILQDAKTIHLKRFGETEAGLEKILDPKIDEIVALLLEIERLFRGVQEMR
jgi:hypothetical protein